MTTKVGEVTEIEDSSRECEAGQDLWEQVGTESVPKKGGETLLTPSSTHD